MYKSMLNPSWIIIRYCLKICVWAIKTIKKLCNNQVIIWYKIKTIWVKSDILPKDKFLWNKPVYWLKTFKVILPFIKCVCFQPSFQYFVFKQRNNPEINFNIKGIVPWSAVKKFYCRHKLKEYHLTYNFILQ